MYMYVCARVHVGYVCESSTKPIYYICVLRLRPVCMLDAGINAVCPLGTECQDWTPLSAINCGLVLDLTHFEERIQHIRCTESHALLHTLLSLLYCTQHTVYQIHYSSKPGLVLKIQVSQCG